MPFKIAESTASGQINSGTIVTLRPGPTFVSYPEKFEANIFTSKDGNPIIQHPLKDGGVRSWVWVNYRNYVPGYTNLYNQLLQLHHKLRINAGKSPWIYVFDDESANLTRFTYNGSKWVETETWVRVKVSNVTQNLARQGGPAKYDETRMDFLIDDDSWNGF